MKPTSLFFALLWRTFVACVVIAIVVHVGGILLHVVGIDLPSPDIANTASFIKLKPSLLYATFALVFLSAEFGLRYNLVRLIPGSKPDISIASWRLYILGLSVLLLSLSALNLLVSATTSIDTWITYKLFGVPGIFVAGIYVLAYSLARRAHE